MLTFVGLGLYDCDDISVKGLKRIQAADLVLIEDYTSRLMGCTHAELERSFGRTIVRVTREEIEISPDWILSRALSEDVVLLSAGDPMVSTTHVDLRIRAASKGVETGIVHGASIMSAVCGLTGLQNYRFGRSCSIPFPHERWFPTTPLEVILQNFQRDLHTLAYLDIQGRRYMTIGEALELLERMAELRQERLPELFVGIARAGSDAPLVRAGALEHLMELDFGPPLHILVVPASLHPVEQEYLELFAGL